MRAIAAGDQDRAAAQNDKLVDLLESVTREAIDPQCNQGPRTFIRPARAFESGKTVNCNFFSKPAKRHDEEYCRTWALVKPFFIGPHTPRGGHGRVSAELTSSVPLNTVFEKAVPIVHIVLFCAKAIMMREVHNGLKAPRSAKFSVWLHYISIARPEHWFKNLFVLPGFAAALFVAQDPDTFQVLANLFVGLVATCLIASANYSINEWLDAEFDRQHPTKKHRPAARGLVNGKIVWIQWAALAGAGLFLSTIVGLGFLACAALLLFMGLVYNVPPIRTKDTAYVDVITESFNNPIRFLLGWTVVLGTTIPPSSILLAYWMGGAFLMAIKRFSEFRFIGDQKTAGRYRKSFNSYSEHSLLASSFFYALSCSFLLGVFLIKYRIEYLVLMPLVGILFTGYLWIGLRHDSVAQRPEELYTQKRYIAFLIFLCVSFVVLSFVDIPWLNKLLEPIALK